LHSRPTVWEWIKCNWYSALELPVIFYFLFLLTALVVFHTYLSSNNLTTCKRLTIFNLIGESLSWEKISYLKNWPIQYGSPFSEGAKKNLHYFFCSKLMLDKFTIWKIPKELPKNKKLSNATSRWKRCWGFLCRN
jgi:hypothetical protein